MDGGFVHDSFIALLKRQIGLLIRSKLLRRIGLRGRSIVVDLISLLILVLRGRIKEILLHRLILLPLNIYSDRLSKSDI